MENMKTRFQPSDSPLRIGLLTAGVSRVDITPPIGQRMQGIVRRFEPSEGIESPLTATSLVIDDGTNKVAILDCDILGFDVPHSDELRRTIGAAIGIAAGHVFLGATHTHTGPTTFRTSGLGITKWGDDFDEDAAVVEAYLVNLGEQLTGSVRKADKCRVPVRTGSGCGKAKVGINREEHLESGRTVLGRNPNGPCDHRVEVLRIDRLDGSPLAILTGYAAHPVVMGWTANVLSPDYPGVVRRVVEQVTGAKCLFMTGAAGNQASIEFLQDDWAEVERIGAQIGCAAAQAAIAIDTRPHHMTREFDASLSSLAIYRKVLNEDANCESLTVASRRVYVPYGPLPTPQQLEAKLREAEVLVKEMRANGAPTGRLFATLVTQHWAENELQMAKSGSRRESLDFDIVGFRLGDFAAVGMAGEPFVEIGLEVKKRSKAIHTLFCGYSTGLLAYWPDAATVRGATAMSVTSAITTHGLSAPPCEDNNRIICDSFAGLLSELDI